uniref:uncharacterized protein LOC101301070 isoform X3 n=2 Tax=Fragaria vesca subsp. vesca TaxID=101020 RepID=UPI0005C9E2BF|nr:PREDICTED: uncharacterized protein LOC101301070 isoform X3 [Fragaria vesca subsp. vesca]
MLLCSKLQVPLLSTSDVKSMLARDEISEWFTTVSTRNSISIPMPQNQADDNKWKGIAACAIFAVKGHIALSLIEPDPNFLNYSYQITWETDDVLLEPDVLELDSAELGRFGLSSHLLVIFSISRSVFPPRELIQSTVVRAKFETTNPSMVVQKCGMRLVYDQDVGWFTRVTEHDVICLDQVEISTPLGEAHWLCQSLEWEKIIPPLEEETTVLVLRKDLESVLPRYLEFNPSALNCYPKMFKFNLGGSPGWFREGLFMWSNSAVMPMELPENLHKSKKWMGLAIFASLVEEVGQTMKEDNLVQPSGYDATWFYYRPCTAARKEVWRQCKLARITVWLSTPRLAVQGCALRLLFKEDVEHLVESLTLAGYF